MLTYTTAIGATKSFRAKEKRKKRVEGTFWKMSTAQMETVRREAHSGRRGDDTHEKLRRS